MNNKINFRFTIEIHSIIRDIINNFIVIVMCVLIGLMGVYIVSQNVYSPKYTSSATLIVNSKVSNSTSMTSLSISSDITKVFAEIFVQPAMKSKAAENLGLNSFDGTITARAVESTNILQLSVSSESPETSYELINSVLKVYPQISDEVFDNAIIDIIKMPAMAKAPSNSISSINKLLIVVICTAFGVGSITLLSIMRDTVKNESDFSEKIDSRLIGTVIHESKRMKVGEKLKKRKKSLIINESTFLSLKFTESYHKIAAKIEYAKRRNGDKIFAVTSVAENEGKSTTSSNIAIALASKGNKVVLIDLDEKKPALYKIFEQKFIPNTELSDLFAGKISTREYKFRRYRKTDLFLALNTSAHKDYKKWIDNGSVEKILKSLKKKVDFIIVDTAPMSVDSAVTDIVKMVDQTIVVTRTDVVPTATINDTLLTITEMGGNLFGCILNDVYPEFDLFGQTGFDEGGYYYNKRYGYGKYGKYGKYSKYSKYGRYGNYSNYSKYGSYGKDSNYGGIITGMEPGDDDDFDIEHNSFDFFSKDGDIN